MDKQNIVVTYSPTTEEKGLLLEVLGSLATLTFLNEIQSAQREQVLERADVLLSWNFPREILPHEYPRLQHVTLIQLVTAGADHMPFAELPSHIIVASNPGAYATPMAEHILAMTLALAKRLLIEHQKLRNGEFEEPSHLYGWHRYLVDRTVTRWTISHGLSFSRATQCAGISP